MLRKAQNLDPIIFNVVSPNGEWIIGREPYLPSDPTQIDEVNEDIDYLDATISNITTLEKEDDGDAPIATKRQREN